MKLTCYETPLFTRLLPSDLDDEEYRALQLALPASPDAGPVIPGTGGFRKLRWDDPRRGKGKRGGLRIVYYLLAAERQVWFFTLYGKDETADLTPDQKAALKHAIQTELVRRRATP